ncbi:MAG: response regulator [Bacteroidetes bacterium]|jgi:FixJ family two-component response regulator|nr:response regulator [Bacteroidota bacterium]MBT6687998.1 response regulator [Bacteroidota bacterium]MBT7144937.1 response regulator [Bacteroidota bacterium]MBT7492107.1 response regulator [Bacteroidota bacterium]
MLKKFKKTTVHIVDDNEMYLKYLEDKFISSTTHEIHIYTSGEIFLREYISSSKKNKGIAIIVLDYYLNSINENAKNGIEILKIIKEVNRNAEVILHSSNVDDEIEEKAMRNGASNFIVKNENSFFRLQNGVQLIISNKELLKKKKQSLLTRIVFGVILLLISIFALIMRFFPLW